MSALQKIAACRGHVVEWVKAVSLKQRALVWRAVNARREPLTCALPMTHIAPVYSPPPDDGLDILYQDAALLVVAKPSGLLAVPGRGADKQDCLATRVQVRYPGALAVHRLDMGTSGLMVMALDPDAHRLLGRQFELRQVEKHYIAIVAGCVAETEQIIDLPLICDWPNRPRQIVDHAIGRPALTQLQVLSYDPTGDTTRVQLMPETGRSHQLRVHLQAIGHAILGDELYAPPERHAQAPRLLLHAAFLAFTHPRSGARLTVSCPPPF
jgi:tRNA pseudouridine32 synthase/23S rRNA pseudouridine746 synthase